MDIAKLKQLNKPDGLPENKPEDLLEEYHVKLNLYAIPPETLERLMTLILGIAGEQVLIKQQIEGLPGWEQIKTRVNPVLANILDLLKNDITGITAAVEYYGDNQKPEADGIKKEISRETAALATRLTKHLTAELNQNRSLILQGFAQSPAKFAHRLIWMAVGFGAAMIFFLLLTLLRIL